MFIRMRLAILFILVLLAGKGLTQVVLNADGPGNTYSLINSVLAPGFNAIEVPDCGHSAFGEHIDEVFDNELNTNVFRFRIHTSPDDDRCINVDRQRNEIKTYDKSPANLLGVENESVRYHWKFKLADGFQSSPKFTHIHQLKSVGDPFDSMPLYTLTTRKGSPDRLELRHAETGTQVTLTQTDLAPLLDTWIAVTETIQYTIPGFYSIEMKRVSDDSTLFSYSNNSIANWRSGATFIRPKWGIYRSLLFPQDLRDEEVLFAGFSIEEFVYVSSEEGLSGENAPQIFPNPVSNALTISNMSGRYRSVQLFSCKGKQLMEKAIRGQSRLELDLSAYPQGAYFLRFVGDEIKQSQLLIIQDK